MLRSLQSVGNLAASEVVDVAKSQELVVRSAKLRFASSQGGQTDFHSGVPGVTYRLSDGVEQLLTNEVWNLFLGQELAYFEFCDFACPIEEVAAWPKRLKLLPENQAD
jgi:hypothetical protein